MNTVHDEMLESHDPGQSQTLVQQIVGGFLAIIGAMAAWIAKLKREKGLSEREIRRIIREEVAAEIAWRFGKP